MRASTGIFPSLGRYFKTMTELANAGCMSRKRAFDCVNGFKTFTEQEKRAIVNSIIVKLYRSGEDQEINEMVEALTDFDKVFKGVNQ